MPVPRNDGVHILTPERKKEKREKERERERREVSIFFKDFKTRLYSKYLYEL